MQNNKIAKFPRISMISEVGQCTKIAVADQFNNISKKCDCTSEIADILLRSFLAGSIGEDDYHLVEVFLGSHGFKLTKGGNSRMFEIESAGILRLVIIASH